MNFCDRSQTLLEVWRYRASRNVRENNGPSAPVTGRQRHSLRKTLGLGLTVILLHGTEVPAEPLKLAYAALSAGQVASWIAKEGGYLSKYGIEGELIYIPAVAATQALIAGGIQRAQVTGVSTSGAILAGADVRIVASSLNRIVGSIYARPEIKSPEDLKGKKLGISRFGALSETAVAIFLERFGLKRGTDVAIIQ